MMKLGAKPIVERGDGNDDQDIDTDFEDWKANLLSAIDASNLLTRRVVRITSCSSLDDANSEFATSHSCIHILCVGSARIAFFMP